MKQNASDERSGKTAARFRGLDSTLTPLLPDACRPRQHQRASVLFSHLLAAVRLVGNQLPAFIVRYQVQHLL